MVVAPVGVDSLVAGDPARRLDALHQPQLLQQLERPVDAGAADRGPAAAQLRLQLQGGHCAVVAGERLDHGGAGAATPVARLAERPQRVLAPCGVDGGGHLSRS